MQLVSSNFELSDHLGPERKYIVSKGLVKQTWTPAVTLSTQLYPKPQFSKRWKYFVIEEIWGLNKKGFRDLAHGRYVAI